MEDQETQALRAIAESLLQKIQLHSKIILNYEQLLRGVETTITEHQADS